MKQVSRRTFLKIVGFGATVPFIKIPIGHTTPTTPRVPSEWVWTEKNGYLVCEQASEAIREAGYRRSLFMQFVEILDESRDLKKHPDPEVESFRHVDATPPDLSKITVSEHGRAVTGVRSLPTIFDKQDPIQKALIKQMAMSLDRMCAGALKGESHPTAQWSEYSWVSGPPYKEGWYIGICGTKFLRKVKLSPSFEPSKKPTYIGEVGTTRKIKWIECRDSKCFYDEGVIFGKPGLRMIIPETPSLHAKGDWMGWYGVMGVGADNVIRVIG